MAPKRIFFDKTEIVFMVPGRSNVARCPLLAKEIVRIQFDEIESKFLGVIPQKSETITVVSGKLGAPIVYKKTQNKKYFNEYKKGLVRFVKENNVSFTDNTKRRDLAMIERKKEKKNS